MVSGPKVPLPLVRRQIESALGNRHAQASHAALITAIPVRCLRLGRRVLAGGTREIAGKVKGAVYRLLACRVITPEMPRGWVALMRMAEMRQVTSLSQR